MVCKAEKCSYFGGGKTGRRVWPCLFRKHLDSPLKIEVSCELPNVTAHSDLFIPRISSEQYYFPSN
jgi:hypothetical protein